MQAAAVLGVVQLLVVVAQAAVAQALLVLQEMLEALTQVAAVVRQVQPQVLAVQVL
jgi:hypothetical protein